MDAYTAGAYTRAEEEFRAAVRLDPGMADAWLGLHALRCDTSGALLAMHRHRKRFGEQRTRHRRPLSSWYWLGWWVQPVLEDTRDLALAHASHWLDGRHLAELDVALAQCPPAGEDPSVRFLHACRSYLVKDWEQLIRDTDRLLDDPLLGIEAGLFGGMARVRLDMCAQAQGPLAASLARCRSEQPQRKELRYWLARAYEGAGRSAAALPLYRAVHRADPAFMDTAARLAAISAEDGLVDALLEGVTGTGPAGGPGREAGSAAGYGTDEAYDPAEDLGAADGFGTATGYPVDFEVPEDLSVEYAPDPSAGRTAPLQAGPAPDHPGGLPIDLPAGFATDYPADLPADLSAGFTAGYPAGPAVDEGFGAQEGFEETAGASAGPGTAEAAGAPAATGGQRPESGGSGGEPRSGAGGFDGPAAQGAGARSGNGAGSPAESGPAATLFLPGRAVGSQAAQPHRVSPGRSGSRQELDAALDALERMVGLDPVKRQVRALSAQLRMSRLRAGEGLPVQPPKRHFVFSGPSGTGKTTVARILGRVFHSLGLLSGDHLVEAQRADLVGEFLGQTAVKANELIDSALDGVLFIDEAYSLSNSGYSKGDAYGDEALQVLLKRAEDNRDRLVVILAGYPEGMNRLLATNPGLNSRFTTRVDFPSYRPGELTAIGAALAGRDGDGWDEDATEELASICAYVVREGWIDELGNGRFIRTLYEKSCAYRDLRLSLTGGHPSREDLATLRLPDLVQAYGELIDGRSGPGGV
ncbi:AAA family ATPase [Kitasatospora sp. NPDC057015]|uniref:AAA family ATPase n=1 Tax=Kitasatospora sp. NPDC057015 TaxID=3346001 RepID=UPI003637ECC7